ncbi:hypothetical protein, partial [uncultured Duncaniella sp.]|uniref:hypothetical protein n=1 Tax=uncultured Duncaniella sp. TaxID=2768039 RepID=UPI0025B678B8
MEEVSALLSQAGQAAGHASVSAKDTAVVLLPVELTAEDLVSKVYGVVDPGVSKDECVRKSCELLRLTPEDDSGALWLETAGGYGVNYYGMIPDVSAMARFGDEKVSDFGYFFLFPYSAGDRQSGIRGQTDFCASLLQEMTDIGLSMDLNTETDDLFEAVGDYKGSFVDIRLLDDRKENGSGRYILILSVEPGAFTPADDIT